MVKKPRGIRRDRDCRNCKSRDIKCDLNRPRCMPCIQAGLTCGGYPQRVVWVQDGSSKRTVEKSEKKTNSINWMTPSIPVEGALEGPVIQHSNALQKWPEIDQKSFIRRLTTFCDEIRLNNGDPSSKNHYLSEEAIRLVYRLCDFMRARITDHSTSDANGMILESIDVANHRLAALTDLNRTLESANPFAIVGIATFAFFEVYDSSFGQWQCHLYGARSLLDYHCKSRDQLDLLSQDIPSLVEIVARLVWFDTLGAVVRESTGLIFDDWHRELLDENFFKGVGCPADTFRLFTSIAKGEVVSDPLESSLRAMDQLLRLDTDPTDWNQCTNGHRLAAAIAILSKIKDGSGKVSSQTALDSAVERACQIIAWVTSSSDCYVFLAPQAYLAGINASTIQQCEIVRNYWQKCSLGGSLRYQGGLAKCEEIWRQRGLCS